MHNGRSIQKQQTSEEEESSKLKLVGHLHDALINVLFIYIEIERERNGGRDTAV
jgi:hypothetical protein